MRAAKVPFIARALRRSYPDGLPARITPQTRITLLAGGRISLRDYCRYAWYFETSGRYTPAQSLRRIQA